MQIHIYNPHNRSQRHRYIYSSPSYLNSEFYSQSNTNKIVIQSHSVISVVTNIIILHNCSKKVVYNPSPYRYLWYSASAEMVNQKCLSDNDRSVLNAIFNPMEIGGDISSDTGYDDDELPGELQGYMLRQQRSYFFVSSNKMFYEQIFLMNKHQRFWKPFGLKQKLWVLQSSKIMI